MEDDDGSTSIQMYLKPLNCTLKRGSKDKFYAMSLYSSTEPQWDILTEKLKKKKKRTIYAWSPLQEKRDKLEFSPSFNVEVW